jgi:hypothetical protein
MTKINFYKMIIINFKQEEELSQENEFAILRDV